MPPSSSINQHHVVVLLRGMGHRILSYRSSILAVSLLVQLDAATFSLCQLFKVAYVYGELLDRAGSKGISGGDQDLVLVLEEEIADFREVGGFSYAVDANDGHYVGTRFSEGGARWGGNGVDFSEKIEGRSGG